jgi:hypothetical protein
MGDELKDLHDKLRAEGKSSMEILIALKQRKAANKKTSVIGEIGSKNNPYDLSKETEWKDGKWYTNPNNGKLYFKPPNEKYREVKVEKEEIVTKPKKEEKYEIATEAKILPNTGKWVMKWDDEGITRYFYIDTSVPIRELNRDPEAQRWRRDAGKGTQYDWDTKAERETYTYDKFGFRVNSKGGWSEGSYGRHGEASVVVGAGGVAYEELAETVKIKPSSYSSIEEKDYWEAEDPDGTRFLDEKEKKLKIEQGKVDAYRLSDDDSVENPLVNGDFFKDGVGIITEKDLRNKYSTDTGTIFSQENFDKWRSEQGYMNAEELDADRYQKAGERFALDIGNNMRSETHIEDLNEQISNLIPGIQTYIKRHEIGGGWYEGNENPTNKPGGSGGEKVVIVAADLIYEEDGKTRRQFKDGGYITDIHGKMYIGAIDFHPKWGDSDLTKKRLKELYYIYKDKKKEKKENYPIVNIINGIFSDNDPGTVDGGQIGSKKYVDDLITHFLKTLVTL